MTSYQSQVFQSTIYALIISWFTYFFASEYISNFILSDVKTVTRRRKRRKRRRSDGGDEKARDEPCPQEQ